MLFNANKFSSHLLPRLLRFSTAYVREKAKSAGIIVIGDEILKGDVVDTNSSYMTPKLHEIGVQVKKIVVIGDDLKEITNEVRSFSSKYNYVITTGGIGPTHDDVTFEGVSLAFNERLIVHPELYKLCCEFFNTTDINYPGMKLSRVPQSSILTYPQSHKSYPNVRVKNVYMFPGVPQLFQKSFNLLHKELFYSPTKFYSKVLYLTVSEDKVAPYLDNLVKSNPNVLFGSYPDITNKLYMVRVCLESVDQDAVNSAYEKLISSIPEQYIAEIDNNKRK
ncbi:FAD synthase-like [Agrilus planipennis]|uniref:FAD synthase-like n=1 Tax=Agrilus planipennis TaxID=224129 RepID=A0A1W4XWQ4_AGRPL|nr:FAD synthase-like [Agrilus planipennis]